MNTLKPLKSKTKIKRKRDFLFVEEKQTAAINSITQLLIDKGISTMEEMIQYYDKEYQSILKEINKEN